MPVPTATVTTNTSSFVEWCARGRALPGQTVSGDAHFVEAQAARVLLAVVDGLGHGADAARASSTALATLQGFSGDLPAAFAACNAALAATRGAAMTLATIEPAGTLTWAGIGNVEGFVLQAPAGEERAREHLTLRGGVVGGRPAAARVSTLRLAAGDVLVLATDGIISGNAGALARNAPVDVIADDALQRFARASDDALVLVARYLGASAGEGEA